MPVVDGALTVIWFGLIVILYCSGVKLSLMGATVILENGSTWAISNVMVCLDLPITSFDSVAPVDSRSCMNRCMIGFRLLSWPCGVVRVALVISNIPLAAIHF